jgi:hypothetical protein
VTVEPPSDGLTTGPPDQAAVDPGATGHPGPPPSVPDLAVPGPPGPGPASRLLAEGVFYTDESLLTALRARLAELERRAGELEGEVLAAQARLGALVKRAGARSDEAENELVAALVPRAREEAVAILADARRRAAELGLSADARLELEDLGTLLLTHFELQERLVRLVTEMTSGARG